MFDGTQIRKLMMDDSFTETMTEIEEGAWNAFKEMVKKFLGNIKDALYSKTCLKRNLKGPEHFSAKARFPFNQGTLHTV